MWTGSTKFERSPLKLMLNQAFCWCYFFLHPFIGEVITQESWCHQNLFKRKSALWQRLSKRTHKQWRLFHLRTWKNKIACWRKCLYRNYQLSSGSMKNQLMGTITEGSFVEELEIYEKETGESTNEGLIGKQTLCLPGNTKLKFLLF